MQLSVLAAAATLAAVAVSPVAAFNKYNMLCMVNRVRKQYGLYNLGLDPRLCESAMLHSEWMARHHEMSHDESNGSDPSERMSEAGYTNWLSACENIAYGQRSDEEVFSEWMHSTGHRENILSPQCTHFGYGYSAAGGNTYYFTQDFAGDGRRYHYPTCPGRGEDSYGSQGGYGGYGTQRGYGGYSNGNYRSQSYGGYSNGNHGSQGGYGGYSNGNYGSQGGYSSGNNGYSNGNYGSQGGYGGYSSGNYGNNGYGRSSAGNYGSANYGSGNYGNSGYGNSGYGSNNSGYGSSNSGYGSSNSGYGSNY